MGLTNKKLVLYFHLAALVTPLSSVLRKSVFFVPKAVNTFTVGRDCLHYFCCCCQRIVIITSILVREKERNSNKRFRGSIPFLFLLSSHDLQREKQKCRGKETTSALIALVSYFQEDPLLLRALRLSQFEISTSSISPNVDHRSSTMAYSHSSVGPVLNFSLVLPWTSS